MSPLKQEVSPSLFVKKTLLSTLDDPWFPQESFIYSTKKASGGGQKDNQGQSTHAEPPRPLQGLGFLGRERGGKPWVAHHSGKFLILINI